MSTTNIYPQETEVSYEVEISDAASDIRTPEGQQSLEQHKEKLMKLWHFCQDNKIKNYSYSPVEIFQLPEEIDVGYALLKWLRQKPDISGYVNHDSDSIGICDTWSNLYVPPELHRYGDRDLRTSQGQRYYQQHKDKFMKLWKFCQENNIKSFEYRDIKVAHPSYCYDGADNDAGYSLVCWLRKEPDIAGRVFSEDDTIFVGEDWCNDDLPLELRR